MPTFNKDGTVTLSSVEVYGNMRLYLGRDGEALKRRLMASFSYQCGDVFCCADGQANALAHLFSFSVTESAGGEGGVDPIRLIRMDPGRDQVRMW